MSCRCRAMMHHDQIYDLAFQHFLPWSCRRDRNPAGLNYNLHSTFLPYLLIYSFISSSTPPFYSFFGYDTLVVTGQNFRSKACYSLNLTCCIKFKFNIKKESHHSFGESFYEKMMWCEWATLPRMRALSLWEMIW